MDKIRFEDLSPAAVKGLDLYLKTMKENRAPIILCLGGVWAVMAPDDKRNTRLVDLLQGMVMAFGGSVDDAWKTRRFAVDTKNMWIEKLVHLMTTDILLVSL